MSGYQLIFEAARNQKELTVRKSGRGLLCRSGPKDKRKEGTMAVYEFSCLECKKKFEVVQAIRTTTRRR